MAKNRKKKKTINKAILKIIIVLLFLFAIIITLNIASNNYIRNDIKDKMNLVINNSNETNNLKADMYVQDGIVYIAKEDIANFFDATIVYDERYNHLITCSDKKVASLPIGKKEIKVNSATVKINGEVVQKEDTYYIPFSELENVYNVKINYVEESNIVTVDYLDREYIIATVGKNVNVKYKPTGISRTVEKVEKGETLVIADSTEFEVANGWTRVRTKDGVLGYVKTNTMGEWNTIRETIENQEKMPVDDSSIWDYSLLKDNTLEDLNDYNLREKEINKIVDYIVTNNLQGVNVQFENINEADQNIISRFLIELEPHLNEIGVVLYVNDTKN